MPTLTMSGMFAIVVLLSFSLLHDVNAVLTYMEQSYSYPHKQVMYNEYSFKEGNLVYAVCDGTTVEKICTVVQRQFPDDLFMRSCNVTLKVQHPKNVNLTNRVSVLAFDQEHAILFWGEIGLQGSFNLAIIRLDNCKMKDMRVSDTDRSLYSQQISSHKILIYNTSFDMFFDIHPVDTQDLKRIRVRVNQEFNLEFDNVTKSENGSTRFISPIATRSPDKGYIYDTLKNLWLVKPDGTQKLLANHENQLVGTSAGYDVITSCATIEMNSQTICTQYDENGNVNFKVTLEHDRKTVVMWQVVHNTPRGGFLLMTTSLKMSDDKENYHIKPSGETCEIVRINDEGKRVGSIRLKGFYEGLQNAKTHSIWKNKDQFCVASIGQLPRNTSPADNLDVVVNCFTENDFIA